MSIYCTYITFYSGNKLPPFYIGLGTISKIKNGYNGSVSSKVYKSIWEKERKENPNLFKTKIIKEFEKRIDASTHEEYLQRIFKVHKNPLYINRAIGHSQFNLSESLQNKTHHFYDSKVQTQINLKRIAKGSHQFIDKSFQSKMSAKQKNKPYFHENQSKVCSEMNKQLVANGTHNLLGCGEFVKATIKEKLNRQCVNDLKEILKINPTKLGQNWWRKSDEWILAKIQELRL